jgi:predicted RNA-binding protein associated with RNAse of E/G family
MLDEGVDMAQPVGFAEAQADWWYIDLVRFDVDGTNVRCDDMYIDVVVGTPDQPYSVLDLEEFGDALRAGTISVDEAAKVLDDCQRFIDRRLNRHKDPMSDTWPDFPPRELEPVLVAPIPPLASI